MSLTKVTYSMIQGATVSVLDYGAVGDGAADDTAAIIAAVAAANGGIVSFPKGEYRITGTITVTTPGTSFIGEGSESTKITNDSTSNALVFGNGSIEMAGCTVQGLTIEGDNASGIGFWGRIFASGSGLNDVQIIGGSIGAKLDVCYAMRMYNVRVRNTVGDGIQANTQCHNTMLIGSKVQVCGGNGLSVDGCYAFYVDGSNFEFNQQNQIYLTSATRGASIRGSYFEGIMPTASGYAGVYVNDCDSLIIDGCYFDATQTGIEGTDGTGTYLKAVNGSRIDYKNNGFASVAASQTHVNFAATVSSGTATVPLGATYVNATQNCRVYNDVKDEIGALAYSSVAQTYTSAAWTDLVFSTELYDPKAELNSTTGVFTPKDYGVYTFNVDVGVAALAVDKAIYVRLLDSINASTLAQYQVYNPTAATDPVFNITFTEFLDKAFSYKLQLFNDDIVNRNSVPGRATHRCSFKRIG